MLLAVYVGCLTLGGVLIGASLVGGGGDDHDADGGDHDAAAGDADHGDLDHDHGDHDHADHAHDAHAHGAHDTADPGVGALVLATLLSLRFWTFALAAFGLTGVLLELFGVPPAVGLVVSVLDGLVVGGMVTTVLRHATRETVSSALDARRLSGADAEVVLSVGPGKTGKIRLTHQGQILELLATTREDRLLERAERVLVVDVKDGTADITSAAPHPPPRSPTATSA